MPPVSVIHSSAFRTRSREQARAFGSQARDVRVVVEPEDEPPAAGALAEGADPAPHAPVGGDEQLHRDDPAVRGTASSAPGRRRRSGAGACPWAACCRGSPRSRSRTAAPTGSALGTPSPAPRTGAPSAASAGAAPTSSARTRSSGSTPSRRARVQPHVRGLERPSAHLHEVPGDQQARVADAGRVEARVLEQVRALLADADRDVRWLPPHLPLPERQAARWRPRSQVLFASVVGTYNP